MPVRSMTLTTGWHFDVNNSKFQMPVRSMTLTTHDQRRGLRAAVSDACQINDFDHYPATTDDKTLVSDACQINDFDHS